MVNMLSGINAYNSQMKLSKTAEELGGLTEENQGASFSQLVENQLTDLIDTQKVAETAKMNAVTGTGDITDLVTAIANAELALNTIVTIRDKAISAYQDIIRMPV